VSISSNFLSVLTVVHIFSGETSRLYAKRPGGEMSSFGPRTFSETPKEGNVLIPRQIATGELHLTLLQRLVTVPTDAASHGCKL